MRRYLIGFGLLGLWPAVSAAEDLNHLAITGQWLKSASVSQVAARLLPQDMAADVVDSRIGNSFVFAHDPPANLRLFARPEAVTSLVCRRVYHFVSFETAAGSDHQQLSDETILHVKRISPSVLVGLSKGEACADLPVERFAHVQRGRTEAEAIELLEWFSELQSRERAPEGVTVTCHTTLMQHMCSGEPFRIFAGLPLEKTYIIDRDGLTVMPQGPGQLYWDVRLETDGEKRRITLEWGSPAPF